jgi:hypothetical protein
MWQFQMFLHLLDGESVGKKVGMRVGGGGMCYQREVEKTRESPRSVFGYLPLVIMDI